MATTLKEKFQDAKEKVKSYISEHGISLKKCEVIVEKNLEEESVIKNGYPNCIIVSRKNIAEATLAYQLVNIAQNKVETPVNIKYLYSLVSEGLADYIVGELYSGTDVENPLGYDLIKVLIAVEEEDIIRDLLKLSYIKVTKETVQKLMESEKVREYFKHIIKPRLKMVRRALEVTQELDLNRPNYLPYGEELKSWNFIIAPKFNSKWEAIQEVLDEYYKPEEE